MKHNAPSTVKGMDSERLKRQNTLAPQRRKMLPTVKRTSDNANSFQGTLGPRKGGGCS
eukprot:CAMPEP_0180698342 /NCGR_PEP_ID=MMETSP1038_2-20121128/3976_1 /TAXON_ID=632150 /ORGANISM="Azadinium spinosum, Strain 3D9" /LENGTH=57 /DNA_ID=CAMNT_0022729911 /DNA_START=247 /DNA_END=417 /DNA_ORIENTATION=+